ncbi:hypothetical protein CL618_01070 [archaeon]|nr:hypothetical protein [archaeon]|tara:strand:+ start:3149 stop:4123 length:975 start_codon:yes stop_codon:yes gene_type:complete
MKPEKLKELYEKGESSHTLAKKFNTDHKKIQRLLKSIGIKLRSRSEAIKLAVSKGRLIVPPPREHKIPNSARKLTLEKAYILGTLCGDGWMHCTKRQSYQIGLNAIDKEFVGYFRDCLRETYGIHRKLKKLKKRQKNWNNQYRIRICSKNVFNDLLDYNSFQTRKWKVPKEIKKSPEIIIQNFIKGFFDSEGTVREKGYQINAVSINSKGIQEIKKLLLKVGIKSNILKRKRINKSDIYNLNITGRKSIELFKNNINFIIIRKRKKLEKLVKNYKLNVSSNDEVKKLIPKMINLRDKKWSYEKIANELGIATMTVWSNLKKVDL